MTDICLNMCLKKWGVHLKIIIFLLIFDLAIVYKTLLVLIYTVYIFFYWHLIASDRPQSQYNYLVPANYQELDR